MNIALFLSYVGTAYHGWQIQKNGQSVQGTITQAIEKQLGCSITLSGVGRTDAGVHARRYIANFKADCSIPLERLPLALNAQLPEDIAIHGAVEVPTSFDARFDCTKKEYAYYIHPSRMRNPFFMHRAYRCTYPLDLEKMQKGAQFFVGTHDFDAVRSVGTPVKSTVRTIYWCEVRQTPQGLIEIRVCGDGFLYNMVRAIAGTLVYVGNGKFTPEQIEDILTSCDREQAGPTLPPYGLFMNRLWYEQTPALAPFGLSEEL